MALPSAFSAFMGITEPAIFGVNMRYFKPFICGCIGGACGALFASITQLGASGTGVTGLFGVLLCLNMPVQYILMMVISIGVSFVLTWMFGYKDEEPQAHYRQLSIDREGNITERVPRAKANGRNLEGGKADGDLF